MGDKTKNVVADHRWAYLLALLPLVLGSIIFFYWFYQRAWYAVDAEIEVLAFLAILMYFVLGAITVILCIVSVIRDRRHWYWILGPLAIVGLTFQAIDYYDACVHGDTHAYVGIDVRGSGITDVELWSTHFRTGWRADPRKERLVLTFEPTYTYNWGVSYSGGESPYVIDSVFIEIHDGFSSNTYALPTLAKGDCIQLTTEEIRSLPKTRSMRAAYGDPHAWED